MLSRAERERHDGMPPDRRGPFLAGRLLLRRFAAELLGVDAAGIEIVAACPDCGGEHGRPSVAGSDLYVSLSHSVQGVVAGASWRGPIGVDLESRPSAGAAEAVGVLSGRASVEHWTRVEAVLKADGRGLRVDPSQVTIEEVDGRLEGGVLGSPTRYDVSEVQLAPGVRVSVAVAR